MRQSRFAVTLGAAVLSAVSVAPQALAQKSGGVLRMYFQDNAPSTSIHEEATNSTVVPFMPVFNNLVLFDQQAAQNSVDTVRPDLAESWSATAIRRSRSSSCSNPPSSIRPSARS